MRWYDYVFYKEDDPAKDREVVKCKVQLSKSDAHSDMKDGMEGVIEYGKFRPFFKKWRIVGSGSDVFEDTAVRLVKQAIAELHAK